MASLEGRVQKLEASRMNTEDPVRWARIEAARARVLASMSPVEREARELERRDWGDYLKEHGDAPTDLATLLNLRRGWHRARKR
jgi:hypothetical protein